MTELKTKDVKAAIDLLDVLNDAHWNPDGSPKLEVLQEALGPELTAADVVKALEGAGRVSIARAKGKIIALPEPEPLDEIQIARVKTKTAHENLAKLEDEIAGVVRRQIALGQEMAVLVAQKDEEICTIAKYSPKVSDADAVKAIQRQTTEAAELRKRTMATVKDTLIAAGIAPQYPSLLDQQLAMRKRSPEHAMNMAKYIHQTAVDRAAARG